MKSKNTLLFKMGIKDINKLITCYKYMDKNRFSNFRIALDFLNFWYTSHAKALKEIISDLPLIMLYERKIDEEQILKTTMTYFIDDLIQMVHYKIVPVTIFESAPFDLKLKYAAIRRKNDRERAVSRLKELNDKLIQNNFMLGDKEKKQYLSVFAQTIHFNKEKIFKEVKNMLDRVGLPWLHCTTEAEHLVCALAREGYVSAGYTTDTDIITIGCPLTITKSGEPNEYDEDKRLIKEGRDEVFKIVFYKDVLRTTQFTKDQFIDVCILTSCDYNERIKMITSSGKVKPVGIKTAEKLIREYGSIENVLKEVTFIGVEKLEVEGCKKIFKGFSVKDLCPDFTLEKIQVKEEREKGEKEEIYGGEETLKILVGFLNKNIPQYILPSSLL